MTWGEFRELFMCKFFSTSSRHAEARKFLELKQGNMTVLEYVAKFTELARFVDDYVASQRYGQRAEIRGWPEVLNLRQDCMISHTGHGLYGQDHYGHRERD